MMAFWSLQKNCLAWNWKVKDPICLLTRQDVELMVGTEWAGLLTYPPEGDATEGEQFPLVLTITKKKKRVLEGTIKGKFGNWQARHHTMDIA